MEGSKKKEKARRLYKVHIIKPEFLIKNQDLGTVSNVMYSPFP
jgi:hypothetical protein